MLLLCSLFWICQLNGVSSKASQSVAFTSKRAYGYGPSYQPRWTHREEEGLRSNSFAYEGSNGPDSWASDFSDCGGRNQSPINIQTKELLRKKTKKPLKWVNYSKIPKTMILENSGHSIHAKGLWKNSSQTPYITNGPLEQRYFFSQLHFHWGREGSEQGSEHTVNNKSFPVEMHVVHDRLLEQPTDLSQESNSNSLVVVSYMFEVDEKDNSALMPILEESKAIAGSEKRKTRIKPFAFEELIEPFHGDYVTYKGSLTTPPCTEGVIWIVNSKPMKISTRQLAILRDSVRNHSGEPIKNYRPVQPLNGRRVYYIFC